MTVRVLSKQGVTTAAVTLPAGSAAGWFAVEVLNLSPTVLAWTAATAAVVLLLVTAGWIARIRKGGDADGR